MSYLLNIYIYSIVILFSIVTFPFGIIYLVFTRLLFSKRFFLKVLRRLISWYGLIIIRALIYPFIKVKFIDASGNDKTTPCIFICNHRSASDPFLLALFPYEIIQIASDWTFRIPFLGFCAKLAGYISIKNMKFDEYLQKTAKLIQQKVCLAAFPEGTRSGSSKMGHFHGAIFRVALKLQCPIVPLCITGNENIPSKKFVFKCGKIKVKRLPAISHEEYKDMDSFKLKNYVRKVIATEIVHMENENE